MCVQGCYIGGTYYAGSKVEPQNPCEKCAPASSTTTWTPFGNGSGCGPPGAICHSGTCTSGCYIGGVYYAPSMADPTNSCGECAPASSTSAWTSLADGTACGRGGTCKGGTCTPATGTGSGTGSGA